MAKISPISIKYIIHAKFEADGAIEKPDMIGAIFGQTEGLLGEELEMRELQKSGKIGRIEVNIEYGNSKTSGEIEIPSAIDKAETALLAAALETIERVGPSNTKITIEDIEDVRGSKRDYILERAKKLMERLGNSGKEINEMTDEIKTSTKTSRIQSYGTENLPCGDISGEELIIVEGRADVINLLKNDIKNAIAMDGAKLPETLIDLTKEKSKTILFVDGDRGGNLIIKNVIKNAKIDFIAMAPEGKEVEELTGKEILQALRKKIRLESYFEDTKKKGVKRYDKLNSNDKLESTGKKQIKKIKKITLKEKEKIKKDLKKLEGTNSAIIFNKDLELIKKVTIGRLNYLKLDFDPYIIAIDGTATSRVIQNCEELGCDNLIAKNFIELETDVNLVSL